MNETNRIRVSGVAGPELDAAVAALIMGLTPCIGWQFVNFGSAGGPALVKTCAHAADTCYPAVQPQPTMHGMLGGPRPYSSDIAAAWQVVQKEELLDNGQYMRAFGPDHWSIGYTDEDGCFAEDSSAPTAPLCICIAALRSKGIKVTE